ncbi:MAG TPA: hypothetical protein VE907_14195 [Gammaproteobacteria bacterium]|nr:hypothetical protein [Gammaproteobacteria bacterium]
MTAEEATIEALRRWSQALMWVSIILPAIGALAAGGRFYVERYEKRLSGRITTQAIQQARDDASAARTESAALKAKSEPRRLSAEQRNAMSPIIAALKGRPIGLACKMLDRESCDYASEIAAVLKGVGCQVPESSATSLNDLPGYIAIVVRDKADPEIANVLLTAFTAAGIPAKVEALTTGSVGGWYQDVVHVVVGQKAR